LLARHCKRLAKRFPNLEIVSADILESDIAKLRSENGARFTGTYRTTLLRRFCITCSPALR